MKDLCLHDALWWTRWKVDAEEIELDLKVSLLVRGPGWTLYPAMNIEHVLLAYLDANAFGRCSLKLGDLSCQAPQHLSCERLKGQ